MKRIFYLVLFLAIVALATVAVYAYFGDMSPPPGPVVIPVDVTNG